MIKAIYPGTFDPLTRGHEELVRRASTLFDSLVLAIAESSPKRTFFSLQERIGMHVQDTAVTGYAVDPNDPNCRIVDYDVTIDGQAGNARIRVCDFGDPGENDVFQIQLSNGYFAGGDLGGTQPGGGNVELHRCP